MPDGEALLNFRVAHPDLLQRGRDQRVKLEVSRDGVFVKPGATSTFSLIRPNGEALIDKQVVSFDAGVGGGNVAFYDISGTLELQDIPDIEFSELYQERWILDMAPEGLRTIRREAAVAPFLWYNPVAQADLTEGEYPDLLTQVSAQLTTLQPFIDAAVRHVLELLFNKGQWPDLMVSTSAFREPIRQRALFLIFKHLFRNTSGQNRWEVLMNHHEGEWNTAWGSLNSRIDADLDGMADDRDRQAARRTVHRNAHPTRSRRRTPRW